MTYVYIDTETTGLDLYRHRIWEIGYAIDDNPASAAFVEHSALSADPEALELNGYRKRFHPLLVDPDWELRFRMFLVQKAKAGEPVTLVGSNPAFDAYRLSYRWDNIAPWSHRMIDVSVYAMPAMRAKTPPGLAAVCWWLAEECGIEIGRNDHTAKTDVEVTREAFKALQAIYEQEIG